MPTITKVFQSGNSQAVRIPKSIRTDQKEFVIRKIGDIYHLAPVSDPWALVKSSLGQVPKNTPFEVKQPRTRDIPKRARF